MMNDLLSIPVQPDCQAFLSCLKREKAQRRVHFIELFLDSEIQEVIIAKYRLGSGLDQNDPFYEMKKQIKLQRFLGYDYIKAGLENYEITFKYIRTEDNAVHKRKEGRKYIDEHTGPITSWETFEKFEWPNPEKAVTGALEWFSKNLPEDMLIIGGLTGHVAEHLTWLMGYETLCYALFEQRELVRAIYEKIVKYNVFYVKTLLQFDRVKIIWGSDDFGFKTGLLLSPEDMWEFVLPAHKLLAKITHDAGRLYILHSCGNLSLIMDELINDVKIDAKHSFEDTIEDIFSVKKKYGDRLTLLGGIDVDFLCRSNEQEIRKRVRRTLVECMPGGGYCLGSGNSITNYMPVENYLIMLDEGRRF